MPKAVVQILRAPSGGIRKHVFDILNSLEHKDIQQIFITNTNDSDVDLPAMKNLKIFHIDISERPESKDISNIFKIYKLLKSYDITVIHGHGAKGGIYARVISFFLRAKCIYTPHGGSLHRVYGALKNKVYSLIEFCLVPFTDVFLFESNYSYEEFSKNICNSKNKSIVNYNGVDIPSEQAVTFYKAGNKLKLASFGLLRHLKGYDLAIHACGMLAQNNIPFEYSIYGTGEEKETLKALIHKYNLQDRIFIKDYSLNVINEMLRYDFVIHPSRFESFGYVPAEAMSVRVPVIVSAEGGLKEVVDHECGYISQENTVESYYKIMKKIYEGDPSLALKIENGFKKVKTSFSKNNMLKKIEEIYFK
jgi:glycosyltransferase involved in cell wall biosynthesis